jgi:hypothetical protein
VFAARPRTAYPHCLTLRHVNDSINSLINAEISGFFDSDDNISDHFEDCVLCFDSKADHDSWQCVALPPLPTVR